MVQKYLTGFKTKTSAELAEKETRFYDSVQSYGTTFKPCELSTYCLIKYVLYQLFRDSHSIV